MINRRLLPRVVERTRAGLLSCRNCDSCEDNHGHLFRRWARKEGGEKLPLWRGNVSRYCAVAIDGRRAIGDVPWETPCMGTPSSGVVSHRQAIYHLSRECVPPKLISHCATYAVAARAR